MSYKHNTFWLLVCSSSVVTSALRGEWQRYENCWRKKWMQPSTYAISVGVWLKLAEIWLK